MMRLLETNLFERAALIYTQEKLVHVSNLINNSKISESPNVYQDGNIQIMIYSYNRMLHNN